MGRVEKRKNNQTKEHKNVVVNEKVVEPTEYDQVTLLIKIIIGLAVIILVTYLILGIFVTKEISFSNKSEVEAEVQINYSKILASDIFEQKPSDYYVIVYDFSSSDSDLINYTLSTTLLVTPYYYVNSIDEFNAKFIIKDEDLEDVISNPSANSYSELKISGPTLIKISNGENVGYVEGTDEIIEYLENLAPTSDD